MASPIAIIDTVIDIVRRPSHARTRSSKTVVVSSCDDRFGAFELSDLANPTQARTPEPDSETHSQAGEAEGEEEEVRRFTFKELPRNRWRLFAASWTVFALGISDGAPGALLPHIEAYYNINYAEVSTIWMANSIGFIVTACMSHWLYERIGRHGMLSLGPVLLVIMNAMIVGAPPFPVVAIAFFFGGLGMAMVTAQINVFLSYLQSTEACFGVCHGSYGAGATIGPLVATAMVSAGARWSTFYYILVALHMVSCVLSTWAFKNVERDLGTEHMLRKYRRQHTVTTDEIFPVTSNMPPMPVSASRIRESNQEDSVYKLALRNRVTWLSAFFVFFYQGVEVSIGGWIVSFMIDTRGGNPNAVGYIASGFWGGVTVGRFVLNQFLSKLLSPRMVIYTLVSLAIAFELITWLLPNIVGAAVAVAIVGLFVGPMYPSAIPTISRQLPRKLQSFSLTAITAFGSTGGALWPFFTGLISQSRGTFVLHPIAVALFSGMFILWKFIPIAPKRD